jgi:N-methylhydantoinase B
MYALDLNPTIMTEDAEFVYVGPYMQYMSGVADTQVKWVLEYRSDNPGISDGDMFLANDPWVGAPHQQDVMLICPVFWEGELFAWITNCLHQYDIGGVTPGSFCPAAESSFDEGICLPPVKIIEGMEIRRDIEEVYLRSSRKPEMVALDFRAQMVGNSSARKRLLELIRRYGPATVKGVMKKIIADSETSYLEKMARLPDGVWQDRTYVECCRPGDRQTYRVILTIRKKGDRLIFENEGTAPQDGAMNATYSGWRGSQIVAINQLLCWDQHFAPAGALRHIDFDPTLGTFTCARHPASVSTAPVQAMEISLYPTYNAMSKMIFSDPEMRRDIICIGGTSQWPATIFRGIDQWGERYGYILVDPIGGAIGAFSHADGISTGGQARTPICKMPNIEHTEQDFPVLFLYRKEVPDSGGAGKYRGGMSAESCFIPHNTESITQDTLSSGNATPTGTGMMGGYPGATNEYKYKRNSDIQSRIETGQMVDDISELNGEDVTLQLRQVDFQQQPVDVYAVVCSAAGGFGDPLDRDIKLVQMDIEGNAVTVEAAREIYCVIVDPDTLEVNQDATYKLRADTRHHRLKGYSGTPIRCNGEIVIQVTENLDLRSDAGHEVYCCAKCQTEVGLLGSNYKEHCIRIDEPVTKSNVLIGEPSRFIDDTPEFRQFSCPGCGTLIENEIAMRGEPVLMDIHIEK